MALHDATVLIIAVLGVLTQDVVHGDRSCNLHYIRHLPSASDQSKMDVILAAWVVSQCPRTIWASTPIVPMLVFTPQR